jgi:hypothetical protein
LCSNSKDSYEAGEYFLIPFAIIGALIGLVDGLGGAVAGAVAGGIVAAIAGMFVYQPAVSLLIAIVSGIIGYTYIAKRYAEIDSVQLTPDEENARNESLRNIERHFSDKEEFEILQTSAKVILMDEEQLKSGKVSIKKAEEIVKERAIIQPESSIHTEDRFIFSDLTVFDKETKLMWTRDGNIADREMKWDDAFIFIEQLNEQEYAGYSDWRLPSIEELKTLVNFAKMQGYNKNINEFFNKIGFKNVEANGYWSSTTYTNVPGTYTDVTGIACRVYLNYGHVADCYKTQDFYVLPVRAEQ